MRDAKTIWIYRRYGDAEGMGEYVSKKPVGFEDMAREYIVKSEHDRIVTELENRIYEYNKETTELKTEVERLKKLIDELFERLDER